MNDNITALAQEISNLKSAQAAREARDVAQDQVAAAQVAALQATIATLNSSAGSNQAAIDAMTVDVKAVIDSLQAAGQQPPVVG